MTFRLELIPLRIQKARLRSRMTQKGLAAAAKVSQQLISRWEQGEAMPGIPALIRLAEALDVNPLALMGYIKEREQAK